ncbi:hypothetical protein THASP1DRAFT_23117 [Thamnocephalis sphaerospora]|uniref:Uncharacterized protein n=1 Tax=Thamnocephalis sphaerospora TaxID=78915 RepID=A0A4P9XS79_9FUNG|nr:hypothetical protein THASP1DRAFT_23117 [Thamnocephalis sphaerospora]|eukprot:RKP08973.1 hypothetical protein THASP1DRAFT_23117 [Thamnocephalis sphaerospora]
MQGRIRVILSVGIMALMCGIQDVALAQEKETFYDMGIEEVCPPESQECDLTIWAQHNTEKVVKYYTGNIAGLMGQQICQNDIICISTEWGQGRDQVDITATSLFKTKTCTCTIEPIKDENHGDKGYKLVKRCKCTQIRDVSGQWHQIDCGIQPECCAKYGYGNR